MLCTFLFIIFAEDGIHREHRQYTWSLVGLAPFIGEEVTVHNTGISLLLSTSAWGSFKSPDRTSKD